MLCSSDSDSLGHGFSFFPPGGGVFFFLLLWMYLLMFVHARFGFLGFFFGGGGLGVVHVVWRHVGWGFVERKAKTTIPGTVDTTMRYILASSVPFEEKDKNQAFFLSAGKTCGAHGPALSGQTEQTDELSLHVHSCPNRVDIHSTSVRITCRDSPRTVLDRWIDGRAASLHTAAF